MAKKRTKTVKKTNKVVWKFPFTKQNYIVFGVGLAVILIGYSLMATGVTEEPAVPDGKWNNPMAVVVAPVLLIIGYLVIIPYGILKFFGNNNSENKD